MKRAVILYHGFITDDGDFGRLYDYLEERYDHIERCLFPGHGENADYSKFTVEATFDVLLSTFDRVRERYERLDVIGFSMGGALSAYLASVRDFDNLVLLSPASVYLNPKMPMEFASFYFHKIRDVLTKSKGEEIQKAKEEELSLYFKNEKKSIDFMIKRLLPNYTVKNLSTFAGVVKRANEHLVGIDNPTLILWGKLDQLVPFSSVTTLMEKMTDPRSCYKVFEDQSHLMLLSENDQEIIDHIISFLDNKYEKKQARSEYFGEYRRLND